MSRYQIKYNNEEEFLTINKLVSDKTFGDDYFRRCGREDIPPNWYNHFSYYLIDKETFGFIGMNHGEEISYTTITVEELEKLIKNQDLNQVTNRPNNIYPNCSYHFFIKDELYAQFATSLLKKYDFNISFLKKKYPVNWVIKQHKIVSWNGADITANPVVPMDEWEDCLAYIVNNQPLEINGYEVEFLENKAIRVGCTMVEFETMKKVWENLKD
jgi:hypothetical protein